MPPFRTLGASLAMAALAGLWALLTAAIAHAQTRPDAGIIQQEFERGRVPGLVPAPRSAPLVEEPARPALSAPTGRLFTVKGFRITRITAFSEAKLVQLLSGYEGREVSLDDLQRAADIISAFYRDRGFFVARAYVPAQDIRDGIVEITVLEGKLEGTRLKLSNGARLRESVVEKTLRAALPEDSLIRLDELERGLLLLKDMPGIEARSVLLPGQALGTSIAEVQIDEGPLLAGTVDVDNFGSKFSGAYRLGSSVNLNNPSGFGDQLSVRATAAAGTSYGRLAYQVPVGYSGLRLGASYGETRYRLCCEFASLDATGRAESATLNAFYPFVRGRDFNLNGIAAMDARHYFNSTIAGTTSDKKARAITVGVSGDSSDLLGGGGLNSFGLSALAGQLDLDAWAPDRAADAASARTHGGYQKVSFALARLQHLGTKTFLYAGLSGQFASKNLDSSEKFILGGPFGVRAYPTGEAAGDEGVLFNLELRHDLQPELQLAAFIDYGEVRLHRNEWAGWQGANTRITNQYSLSGYGIGLTWSLPRNLLVRASVARPIGANAGQDANGHNSDNSPNFTRLWFQAVKFL